MLILKTKRGEGGKLEMERAVMCQRVLKDILRGLGFIRREMGNQQQSGCGGSKTTGKETTQGAIPRI